MLIDACRNELKATSSTRDLSADRVTVPRGVNALFSCGPGQKAHETLFDMDGEKVGHGVFFYFVLDGLRGKAKNTDGDVTWADLLRYVQRRVPAYVKDNIKKGAKQKPHGVINALEEVVLVGPDGERPGREKIDKIAKEYTNDSKFGSMKLKRLSGGTFTMGSPKKEQDEAIADYEKIVGKKANDSTISFYRGEGPQHEVELSPFYLGVYEVTQKQFRAVMGYNPSYFSKNATGKDDVKYGSKPGGGKEKSPRRRHGELSRGECILEGSGGILQAIDGKGQKKAYWT